MTLTCNKNGIASRSVGNRTGNGAATIRFNVKAALAFAHAVKNVIDDGLRILGARVVGVTTA